MLDAVDDIRLAKCGAPPSPPPGMFDDDPALVDHPAASSASNNAATLAKAPTWKTPAERAAALGERLVRLPTGFETIDDSTRGGPATRRRVMVVGPPGAGKTGIILQWGVTWLRQGVHVAFLAADESADELLIRVGQQLGYAREALEDGGHPHHEASKAAFAEELAALHFILVDADEEEGATIETVSAQLKIAANGAPSVLLIDSLQTCRSFASLGEETPRGQTDAKIKAIKAATAAGHLVVCTSEANRAFYANRAMKSDAIASGKESSGIEYAAHLLLALSSVKGEKDLTDVEIPKNRLGRKGAEFRLRWDFRSATFTEVEKDEAEDDQNTAKVKCARFDDLKRRILATIRKNPGLKSANDVQRRLDGPATRTDFLDAFRDLREASVVSTVAGQLMINVEAHNV